MTSTFDQWRVATVAGVEQVLERALPTTTTTPAVLHEAMRYAVLDGGKRLRPLLVHASAAVTACPAPVADAIAAAIEMIHAYSLVHDDMPCMDNDVLRRGKPTVHVAFGEATAMLVGDALQCLAFEVLADGLHAEGNPHAAAVMAGLARAAGSQGMAGGQQIDLQSEGVALPVDQLERLHRMKTGALLHACVVLPAVAAGSPAAVLQALDQFGRTIGLAFQVADDVLDAVADSATLGKTAGKDAAQNKATYVTLLGLETARAKAEQLRTQAQAAIEPLGPLAQTLANLANLIVQRAN
jgi:farnesyl diphosphate synthase